MSFDHHNVMLMAILLCIRSISLDVIKIATRNGADALGILNKVGTIERGKEADMIVLGANPIDKISNTKKMEAIINHGKLVDREEILLNR
jgi:imidazolonepropionase-like amidohydrolase